MKVFTTVSRACTRPLEKGVAFHTASCKGMASPFRAQLVPVKEAPGPSRPASNSTRRPKIPGRDKRKANTGNSRESTNTYREMYPL